MLKKLLLATTNQGKIREIREIFRDLPFIIITLNDLDKKIPVEETGKTFEENAVIKAETIGEKTGLLTLGEDSGLEVDALSGRPGIYSARYCKGSDEDRNNKLLRELQDFPRGKRTARYKAVAAIYDPDKRRVFLSEGVSEGYITQKPIGASGFGYDPIFYNSYLKKTNGQATPAEKNKVSHRGRALAECSKYLMSLSD